MMHLFNRRWPPFPKISSSRNWYILKWKGLNLKENRIMIDNALFLYIINDVFILYRNSHAIGQKVDPWLRNWDFISYWSKQPINTPIPRNYFRRSWKSRPVKMKPTVKQFPCNKMKITNRKWHTVAIIFRI